MANICFAQSKKGFILCYALRVIILTSVPYSILSLPVTFEVVNY